MRIEPLYAGNWTDFVDLMGGESGGCGGCWCTWWRLPRSTWAQCSKDQRRERFKNVVESGSPTGVLLYKDSKAVGWCAVAPQSDYPTLVRSRVAYRIDNSNSWVISCVFVRAGLRRQGLMTVLIDAAARYAFKQGAPAVDGFPQRSGRTGFVERFVGVEKSFLRAGFEIVETRGDHRLAMRRFVKDASTALAL